MNATADQPTSASLYDALLGATDPQREFIADLIDQVPALVAKKAVDWVRYQASIGPGGQLQRAQIRGLITRLVAVRDAQRVFQAEQVPETRPAGQAYPDVEAGRYALTTDGVVHFYQVQRPAKGPHAGRTFLSSQHGDNYVRLVGGHAVGVLRRIEADPQAAHDLYCDELDRCRKCTRSLTDEASRARHYGPDCWAQLQGL